MSDWTSFGARLLQPENTGLSIDLSAMDDAHEAVGLPRLEAALAAMRALEAGAIANPDEGRQVGHYWLRAPRLAPSAEQGQAVEGAIAASERVAASLMERFAPRYVLHLGIGGSALGPELLAEALAPPPGRGRVALRDYHVLDNTDPAGFEAHLAAVDPAECVVLVVSKSGGTVETRNAMLRVRQVFEAAGVDFPSRAVAITGDGSRLSRLARAESWAGELPLWDWVGGRTSVMGPVGLLPAALLGIPARELLAGAAAMDVATRAAVEVNPAAQLAAAWLLAQRERPRAMVVLPYADRLRSLSRYLQQLVMESLGKRLDRQGRLVRQGLVVYGNKGSTDQHAFVQQLRDGPDDFFCGFVELLHPGVADPVLEGGFTAGDALAGFLARRCRRTESAASPSPSTPSMPAPSAPSSPCSSARWASTPSWWTSTPTTSPGSRQERRPPLWCWTPSRPCWLPSTTIPQTCRPWRCAQERRTSPCAGASSAASPPAVIGASTGSRARPLQGIASTEAESPRRGGADLTGRYSVVPVTLPWPQVMRNSERRFLLQAISVAVWSTGRSSP
jgi:glucose-6-phosphate isomerase